MVRSTSRGFTLVEILIVVVILGILAAVAVGQFSNTTADAQLTCTINEVQKLRRHIGIYECRHNGQLPTVTAGNGTWGPLVGPDHFLSAPVNAWVGGANSKVIVIGSGPDTSYHTNYAWIFNDQTGEVWAAGFDADDRPFPRN